MVLRYGRENRKTVPNMVRRKKENRLRVDGIKNETCYGDDMWTVDPPLICCQLAVS
jgi:hypothetical protein